MAVSYDVFAHAFLSKVTEYSFPKQDYARNDMVDGYMKRAFSAFKSVCPYDFTTTADDAVREFNVIIDGDDLDEIVDMVSEGMVVQWLKPYLYKQEIMENVLNTRDFTSYSPSELLYRVRESYNEANAHFLNMIREYSYRHNDLTELHI